MAQLIMIIMMMMMIIIIIIITITMVIFKCLPLKALSTFRDHEEEVDEVIDIITQRFLSDSV